MDGCVEETIMVEADIPASRGVVFLTDCNVVVVSRYMPEAQREDAFSNALAEWRRGQFRSAS